MDERRIDRDPEQLRRVLALFERASDLAAPEQEAFLRSAEDQSDVTDAVRAMLNADREHSGDLVASVLAAGAVPDCSPQEEEALPPGHRVGRFTIRRTIGCGGMGTVYEAVQDDPKRAVALKVLRNDVGGTAAERRFRREILALSHLEFPGIARIHDAGVLVERGRTLRWFAMELVDGCPIDQWVRDSRLDSRQVIQTMVEVCRIVHAAHQRGIIHRDLKPANLLVDRDRAVRIIDFGVAAAMSREVIGSAGVTLEGAFVGTLRYTAPEQLGAGARPDVRADVYSLGMVLHELLTGKPALPVDGVPFLESVRILGEQDPVRLGSLRKEWRGDVESIVAKAIDKDPRGRYQSAHEMACDLENHLAGRTIVAAKAAGWARFVKYARRHRVIVGAAVLSLAAMIFGTALAIDGWLQARAAAERAARTMEWVSSAMTDPDTASIERLNELLARLDAETDPDDPGRLDLVKSDVLQCKGEVLHRQRDYAAALGVQEKALAIREAVLRERPDDPAVLSRLSISYVKIGDISKDQWHLVEAKPRYDRALEIDEALVASHPRDRAFRDQLCWSYERCGCLAWQSGDLKLAQRLWQSRHSLALDLVRDAPAHSASWHNLYCSHAYLATIDAALGNEDSVTCHLAEEVRAAERLVDLKPEKVEFQALLHSARLQYLRGSCQGGCTAAETQTGLDALNRAKDWLDAGPDEPRRIRLAAGYYEWRGRQLLADPAGGTEARSQSERWLAGAQKLLEKLVHIGPQDPDARLALAHFCLGRASDEFRSGRLEAAEELSRRGIFTCQQLLEERRFSFTLHTLADALLRPCFGKPDPVAALALLDEQIANGAPLTFECMSDVADACHAVGNHARELEVVRHLLDVMPDGPSSRRTALERRASELAAR